MNILFALIHIIDFIALYRYVNPKHLETARGKSRFIESAKITSLSQIVGFITEQVSEHNTHLLQNL